MTKHWRLSGLRLPEVAAEKACSGAILPGSRLEQPHFGC